MPDEIIRSYLADPFLYNDNSFCSGCGTYVPLAELFWQETNESLLSADRRRKLEFIQRNRLPPNDFVWDAHGPVQRKSQPGGGAESQPSGGVESQPGGGVGWGVAVIAAGGAMALFLLGMVCLGLLTFGARARARPVQPAAFPARPGRNFGRPGFAGPDFARPELPEREVRKSPDLGEIRQEHERQMDRLRKQNDELLNRLRSRNPAQP